LSGLDLAIALEVVGLYDAYVARTLGENLRALRRRVGLSQEDLARRLKHENGRNATISKWERDAEWLPSRQTIRKLCAALQCEPWELFDDAVTPYDRLRVRPRDGTSPDLDRGERRHIRDFEGGRDFERRIGMGDRRKDRDTAANE
jgi:transcriptional regulator with XRE-family HTH domain